MLCVVVFSTTTAHARPSLPLMDQPQQANLMIQPPIGEFEALGEAVMKHIELNGCCPVQYCRLNICSPLSVLLNTVQC